MAFDMDKTLGDMKDAMAAVIAADWPKVRTCTEKALKEEASALKDIAEARITGEIDDEEMQSEIEDEKEVLKAALLACKVKAKVMAQKAANAAAEVLHAAIKTALG
jgi:hypothetical protein